MNLNNPIDEVFIKYAVERVEKKFKAAIKNAFGFGGVNVSLVLTNCEKWDISYRSYLFINSIKFNYYLNLINRRNWGIIIFCNIFIKLMRSDLNSVNNTKRTR